MEFRAEERGRKGATLSDKTARSEYGLTQEEIFAAIDAGKLEYRPAAMHENPWLRVLRGEVEDLVRTWHGERYLGYGRIAPRRAPRRRDRQPLRPEDTKMTPGQLRSRQAARARGPRSGDHHPAVDRECDACDERGFVRREEHDTG